MLRKLAAKALMAGVVPFAWRRAGPRAASTGMPVERQIGFRSAPAPRL
jgi:hypothetical protein